MTWLAVQGWRFAAPEWSERLRPVFYGSIHLLPGFFLAFALAEALNRPARQAILPVLAAFGNYLVPLQVGAIGETITVTGVATELIETSRTAISISRAVVVSTTCTPKGGSTEAAPVISVTSAPA